MATVKDIHNIAKMNHDVLINRLNSEEGSNYIGKWIAIAHGRICMGTRRENVLCEAKRIEPDRRKILLTKIPKRANYPFSFR